VSGGKRKSKNKKMIDTIAYEMAENFDANQLTEFKEMMFDYEAYFYMHEIQKKSNTNNPQDFSDDLPF
jgi:uncharacterized Rmd1/YagE family protein